MRIARQTRIRSRATTVALPAIVLTILAVLPASAFGADLLPDLVATAPTNARTEVTTLGDGQPHFLLRFDAAMQNVGAGPLEVYGESRSGNVMTVTGQVINRTNGGAYFDGSRHPVIRFETADGHDHWHVMNAARYALWNEAGTAEAGRGAKVGFCLEDVDKFDPTARSAQFSNSATGFCEAGNPTASNITEGITPGWEDVYAAKLPFQWVDLSDIAPGRYRLGEQVDPDNVFIESNESNNGPVLAPDSVIVPGWYASSGTVNATRSQTTILLGAQQFGNASSAAFKIESPPKHGNLTQTPGAPAYQFVYTPAPGFAGTDSFNFSARDPASQFPLHPPVATVNVKVPGEPVHAFGKVRLLTGVRFSLRGRFLTLRAHALKSGMLEVRLRKGKRGLGACKKRARAKHGFRCRVKLRRHGSPRGAKAVVSLLVKGRATAVNTFKVPHRLRH